MNQNRDEFIENCKNIPKLVNDGTDALSGSRSKADIALDEYFLKGKRLPLIFYEKQDKLKIQKIGKHVRIDINLLEAAQHLCVDLKISFSDLVNYAIEKIIDSFKEHTNGNK